MDIFAIYYTTALLVLLFMLFRHRKSALSELLVLIAFTGVFSYFIPRGTQYANIVYVLFVTYLVIKKEAWKQKHFYRNIIILFAIFSIYFLLDGLVLESNWLFLFSQYSKYYLPFACFMLFVYYASRNPRYLLNFNQVFYELLTIQCIFGVFKWILMGRHFWEGMVGTFGGVIGGGAGTGFPLIALCWVAVNSNMNIRKWYSWIFVFGLLFVGIAAGKRAVIILYPILFLALSVFVCRKKYSRRVWILIAAVPLMLYLGVRLTPTLNTENQMWGSFDLDYALNYSENYVAGDEETRDTHYRGRLGSVRLMGDILKNTNNYTSQTLFGEGVVRAYTSTEDRDAYNQFGKDYGLDHRGALTGVFFLYIAIGIVGVFLFCVYYWQLFGFVKYKRLRFTMWGLVMFDFICYNSTTVRDPFVNTLLMFTIVYSLCQFSSEGMFVGQIHPLFNSIKKKYRQNSNNSTTLDNKSSR